MTFSLIAVCNEDSGILYNRTGEDGSRHCCHRILYEIHDQVLLVIVVDVGRRREIYR